MEEVLPSFRHTLAHHGCSKAGTRFFSPSIFSQPKHLGTKVNNKVISIDFLSSLIRGGQYQRDGPRTKTSAHL
jgi:hypothetical protein